MQLSACLRLIDDGDLQEHDLTAVARAANRAAHLLAAGARLSSDPTDRHRDTLVDLLGDDVTQHGPAAATLVAAGDLRHDARVSVVVTRGTPVQPAPVRHRVVARLGPEVVAVVPPPAADATAADLVTDGGRAGIAADPVPLDDLRPAQVPTMTTHDGVTLHDTDTREPAGAAGPPLLLLHAWGQTRAMFRHQVEGLSEGRRVVTLDFRGHGESDKPHRVPHRPVRHRRRRTARPPRARAGRRPRLVDGRVGAVERGRPARHRPSPAPGVCRPACSRRRGPVVDRGREERERRDLRRRPACSSSERRSRAGTGPRRQPRARMFSGKPDEAVWAFVQEQITATPAYAGVPLLFDHCAQDWRDVLPRIDIPVLVIGADGSQVDPSSQRYIAEHVRDGQLYVFGTDEANSHFPFLENPTRFNAIVGHFLSQAVPGPR